VVDVLSGDSAPVVAEQATAFHRHPQSEAEREPNPNAGDRRQQYGDSQLISPN
jgi:hypothetical protein